jgi:hypothetical protein
MQDLVKQYGHVKGSQMYADPYKYADDTNATEEGRFGCQLHIG